MGLCRVEYVTDAIGTPVRDAHSTRGRRARTTARGARADASDAIVDTDRVDGGGGGDARRATRRRFGIWD